MTAWRFRVPLFALLLGAAAFGGAAAARDDHSQEEKSSVAAAGRMGKGNPRGVIGTAAEAGKFRTLVNLIVAADLINDLVGNGPFTVFAPTDEAFAKLPVGTCESLAKPENRKALVALLLYHVVPGKILAKDLGEKSQPKTLNGRSLTIAANRRGIAVNDATVLQTDILARNGVIHVVDTVLMPPQTDILGVAEKAGNFGKLLTAIKAAKLEGVLSGDGPFTVFAPTDEAFDKLPKGTLESLLKPANRGKLKEILEYHVLAGKVSAREAVKAGSAKTLQGEKVEVDIRDGRLTINEAKVLATDIAAANGVIHVIDSVLLPK